MIGDEERAAAAGSPSTVARIVENLARSGTRSNAYIIGADMPGGKPLVVKAISVAASSSAGSSSTGKTSTPGGTSSSGMAASSTVIPGRAATSKPRCSSSALMSPGGVTAQTTGIASCSNGASSSSISSGGGAPSSPLKNGARTLDVHVWTPKRSSVRASGKDANIGSQLSKLATSAATRSSTTGRSYA